MATVLILYPTLFACQSKFERKLEKITCRLSEFNIVYQEDPHGFILSHFSEDDRVKDIRHIEQLADEAITHAVVFDDGEEFVFAREQLAARNIMTRWVRIALTRVVNIKRETQYQGPRSTEDYEYIGRGSYWGNPHAMQEAGESREEVIRKYEYDFQFNKFLNIDPNQVHGLAGKHLGCFCKPAPCHGDVLAKFLNSFDDGR
jgi:hypothetical protein